MDSSSPEALADVRASLEALADALANARLDSVLALDLSMAGAVARLRTLQVTAANAAAVRRDLAACRQALARCTRLGATLGTVLSSAHAARGEAPATLHTFGARA